MRKLPDFLGDYTYAYPPEQIAYHPAAGRGGSRLLLVRKNPEKGEPRFEDLSFADLPALAREIRVLRDSLWVRNRSRVLPARLYAKRASGGRHEIVLTERKSVQLWDAIIRNVAKLKNGDQLTLENSNEKIQYVEPGQILFLSENPLEVIESVGRIPLPPYIAREIEPQDSERYQPVWAAGEARSSAAPTASLHFTEELWRALAVESAEGFLHVGRGTFEALRESQLSKAKLHEEEFEITRPNAEKIFAAKNVCAIGTTACRLTETLARNFSDEERVANTFQGRTDLFIRPGFEFKKVRALLTNFHLPESSLLVLVAVFAGDLQLTQEAYAHAVRKNYRLFSYGDASLWL